MKRKAGRVDRNDVKARAAAMRQKKAAAEAAKQKAAAEEEAKRQRSMMPPPPPMAPKPKETRRVALPAEPAPPARAEGGRFWTVRPVDAHGVARAHREKGRHQILGQPISG